MAEGKRWADVKAQHHNARMSVAIAMDAAAADEAERLVPLLQRLRRDDGEVTDNSVQILQTAERIRELEQQAQESEVTFTFEGLGRGRYSKLLSEHPLPESRKDELGDQIDWNPDTFPPALMAASVVEPEDLRGDVAEWTAIHEEWSTGQVSRIWRACMGANGGVNDVPKSPLVSVILAQPGSETS